MNERMNSPLSSRNAEPLPEERHRRLRENLAMALRAAAYHAEHNELNDVRAAIGDAHATLNELQFG